MKNTLNWKARVGPVPTLISEVRTRASNESRSLNESIRYVESNEVSSPKRERLYA